MRPRLTLIIIAAGLAASLIALIAFAQTITDRVVKRRGSTVTGHVDSVDDTNMFDGSSIAQADVRAILFAVALGSEQSSSSTTRLSPSRLTTRVTTPTPTRMPTPTQTPTPECKKKGSAQIWKTDAAPLLGAFDSNSPNFNKIECHVYWDICGQGKVGNNPKYLISKVVKSEPGIDACKSFFDAEKENLPKGEFCCDCYPNCEKKPACGDNVTVKISRPSFPPYFSFLARRSFANVPEGDTITAQAVVTPPQDTSDLTWEVGYANFGTVRDEKPSDKKGATFSFVPDPGPHPPYKKENGSVDQSPKLIYVIRAELCGAADAKTLMQDERDVIRQEYVNHDLPALGIPVPARSDLNPVVATTHFTAKELNNTAYNFIVGNPGPLAEAVRDAYNKLIKDDVQAIPVGTTGLKPDAVVVMPGASIDTIGPILDTPPCNGFPLPSLTPCDDKVVGNTIVAGPNGIAETVAVNAQTLAPNEKKDFDIKIHSGWRNPERNEAVGGVRNSRHQLGNAIDFVVGYVPGKTTAQLNCILQTAGKRVGSAIAESGPSKIRPCNAADVDHIHVQQ